MSTASIVQVSAAVIEDLELWEIEDFEEKAGVALASVVNAQSLPFKAVAALVWVIQRRANPNYTYEQARRLKLADLAGVLNPTLAPVAEVH